MNSNQLRRQWEESPREIAERWFGGNEGMAGEEHMDIDRDVFQAKAEDCIDDLEIITHVTSSHTFTGQAHRLTADINRACDILVGQGADPATVYLTGVTYGRFVSVDDITEEHHVLANGDEYCEALVECSPWDEHAYVQITVEGIRK